MMSQANSTDLNDKLQDDSFSEMMSQADDKDFIIDSPKSSSQMVEKWLATSEPESKKTPKKFTFKKRKLENTPPNFQTVQFNNDPFEQENHVSRSENNGNAKISMKEKVLQAQQAYKRQKFFANFFAKEQELQLELLKERNKE